MHPTSFRFEPAFMELIDAWAEHLSVGRHRRATRAEVLHLAMRRMTPGASEPQEVHAAYADVFKRTR